VRAAAVKTRMAVSAAVCQNNTVQRREARGTATVCSFQASLQD